MTSPPKLTKGCAYCARPANGHGRLCCRMCPAYGTHSTLCRRRNGK